jgi:hypothetical protein
MQCFWRGLRRLSVAVEAPSEREIGALNVGVADAAAQGEVVGKNFLHPIGGGCAGLVVNSCGHVFLARQK